MDISVIIKDFENYAPGLSQEYIDNLFISFMFDICGLMNIATDSVEEVEIFGTGLTSTILFHYKINDDTRVNVLMPTDYVRDQLKNNRNFYIEDFEVIEDPLPPAETKSVALKRVPIGQHVLSSI